jgi:ParB family chromosome partitioning protein
MEGKMAKLPPRKNISEQTATVRIEEAQNIHKKIEEELHEHKDNAVVISIDEIHAPPFHDRRWHNKMAIVELSKSIEAVGLIYPIVVRKIDSGYERIIGFRRIEAYKILGKKEIPAIILENISDDLAILLMATENMQREDVSVYDETLAIIDYIKVALGVGQEEIEKLLVRFKNFSSGVVQLTDDEKDKHQIIKNILKKTGKIEISALINRLNMLSLHPMIKEALSQSKISFSNAQILQKLSDNEALLKQALLVVVSEGLSKRETAQLVGQYTAMNKGKSGSISIIKEKIKMLNAKKIDKLSEDKRAEIFLHLESILKIIEK